MSDRGKFDLHINAGHGLDRSLDEVVVFMLDVIDHKILSVRKDDQQCVPTVFGKEISRGQRLDPGVVEGIYDLVFFLCFFFDLFPSVFDDRDRFIVIHGVLQKGIISGRYIYPPL